MEFRVVHVWVCWFADRAAFEAYMAELPRDDLDDPLSEFISDQGHAWYDHDHLGCHFHDEPSADAGKLLRAGHAFTSSYAAPAAQAHAQSGFGPVNATITFFDEPVWTPRSVRRTAYRVEYIGEFPRDPDAK